MRSAHIFTALALVIVVTFVLGFGVEDIGVTAFEQPTLPKEAEKVVVTAIEDNSWLKLKTEQEFRIYCQEIYAEAMIEPMVASLVFFTAKNDDWHTVPKVRNLEVLKADQATMEVDAEVEYLEVCYSRENVPQDYVSGRESLLITVVEENHGFKVAGIESNIESTIENTVESATDDLIN